MTYYLIIRGPMGSGKSTVAERLGMELGAKPISVDRILDEYNLTDEHEDGYISQRSFVRVNEIIAPDADKLLAKDIPVIFDGNFLLGITNRRSNWTARFPASSLHT